MTPTCNMSPDDRPFDNRFRGATTNMWHDWLSDSITHGYVDTDSVSDDEEDPGELKVVASVTIKGKIT